jgi:glucose-6-phosphate 1-epimerase
VELLQGGARDQVTSLANRARRVDPERSMNTPNAPQPRPQPPSQSIDDLRAAFSMPGVSIDEGNGGLTRVRVNTSLCTGEIYLHGAHVVAFTPTGQQPVLWMSSKSAFAPGKAIRGGVPICYPWFGANAANPNAAMHGLARTAQWDLLDVGLQPTGEVNVILRMPHPPGIGASDDDTAYGDGEGVETYFAVLFGTTLEMGLLVRNSRTRDLRFEAALHTYFTVGDVRQIGVSGLQGARYADKTRSQETFIEHPPAIRFTEETDRVYESEADCVIDDPSMKRQIVNRKLGSKSTVVWNAWPTKAATIGLAENEWTGYVCVETAAIGIDAITLKPGQTHTLGANIGVRAI